MTQPHAASEPLESRTLFVLADPSFGHEGIVTTHFVDGNDDYAEHALALNYGQLMVVGRSFTPGTYPENGTTVFAVYTSTGKLATGFDGDGRLILPSDLNQKVGLVSDLLKFPDGNVLVVGDHGLLKLKTNGTVDKSFGKNGVANVPNYVEDDYRDSQQAVFSNSGGIKVGSYSPGTGLLTVAEFTSTGQPISALRRTIAKDGESIYVTRSYETIAFGPKIRQYRSDLSINSGFGTGGTFDLTPAYTAFAKAHKPWTDLYGDPMDGIPAYESTLLSRPEPSAHGFVVYGHVDGYTEDLPFESDHGEIRTGLTVEIDSNGKHAVFYGATPSAGVFGHTYFRPAASGSFHGQHFGGDFYTKGAVYHYEDELYDETNEEYANGAIDAGGGKHYVFGTINRYNTSDMTNNFAVARTEPINYNQ